jgi:hypothetical protein
VLDLTSPPPARRGRFASIEEAEALIRRARPRVVLDDGTRTAIVMAASIRSSHRP